MGILETVAAKVADNALSRFLKRTFGSGDSGSSVQDQSKALVESLPDTMQDAEDVVEAMGDNNGFTVKYTERNPMWIRKKTEKKSVRFENNSK